MIKLSRRQKECRAKAIAYEMSLFKSRKLRSSSGQLVTNPRQAIAIALSVANRKCLTKRQRTAMDRARMRKYSSNKKRTSRKRTKRTSRKRTKKNRR